MKAQFSALLLLISISSQAQFSAISSKSDEIEQLLQSTTLVVLLHYAQFDSALVHAVKENWNITRFKFIQPGEVDKYIADTKYSFLIPHNLEFTRSNDVSTTTQTRHYLCLFNGGKNKLSRYQFKDLVAFSPFDFNGIETDRNHAAYRLGLMVKSLQSTVLVLQFKKIKGNELKLNQRLCNYYSLEADIIKKKTVLVDPRMLDRNLGEEEIRTIFPFPFLLSNPDWIKRCIEENNADYCYLLKTSSYDQSIQIFDLGSGELCYAYYSLTGGTKLTKKDLKKITKSIIKK